MPRRDKEKLPEVASDASSAAPAQKAQEPKPAPSRAVRKKPPRSASVRDAQAATRGRLPSGSRVTAEFSAPAAVWIGSLIVPATGTDGKPDFFNGKGFYHSADGLFRLLEELDTMYRQWVKEQFRAQVRAASQAAPQLASDASKAGKDGGP